VLSFERERERERERVVIFLYTLVIVVKKKELEGKKGYGVFEMSSPRSKRVRTTKGSSKCDAKDSEGVSNVTTTRKSKSSYVRWTESEDLRLACLHKIHGNRWNEIVKYFPGRYVVNRVSTVFLQH